MDSHESVAGMSLAFHWKIMRQVVFVWEIAIESIEKILPPRLEPVEVRPGVGLMSVWCLCFSAGQLGRDSPEFNELGSAVHVQPSLSLKMPQPRFSFYSNSLWSDSEDFVALESGQLFSPAVYVPSLRIAFSPDGLGAEVSDTHGTILTVRSTAPATAFTATETWGQIYNCGKDLHHGVWHWKGTRFEHMKRGDPGRPTPHSHFGDLDVSKILACYRQMFAEPGRQHSYKNYHVRRLG